MTSKDSGFIFLQSFLLLSGVQSTLSLCIFLLLYVLHQFELDLPIHGIACEFNQFPFNCIVSSAVTALKKLHLKSLSLFDKIIYLSSSLYYKLLQVEQSIPK